MRRLLLVLLLSCSTVSLWAGPREEWRAVYFPADALTNAALADSVWGDAADPDHDGHNNLFEYALGLNPTNDEAATGFTLVRSNGVFQFSFAQRTNDDQLFFKFDFSTNLVAWGLPADWVETNTAGALGFQMTTWSGFDAPGAGYFRVRIAGSRPYAVATNVSLLEDTPAIVQLPANDPGAGTNVLRFVITQLPAKGALYDGTNTDLPITSTNVTLNDPQDRVLYVPAPDTNGADALAFKVIRNWVESDAQSVTLNIMPVDDPPVATPPTVDTKEETAVYFALGGYDVDGDPLISTIRFLPTNGKLYQVLDDGVTLGPLITNVPAIVSNTNKLVCYLPNPGFFREPTADVVNYDLFDGIAFSFTVSVPIGVSFVNHPPVVTSAVDVGYVDEPEIGLYLNISDPDSPINGYITQLPAKGKLYLQGDLSPASEITLTNNHFTNQNLYYATAEPLTGPSAQYTFSYYVTDGDYTSPTNTDTIQVLLRNLPPVLTDCQTNAATSPNTPVDIMLNGLDPDGDSSELVFTITAPPQHGSLATFDIIGNPVTIQSYPVILPSSDPTYGWDVRYTPDPGFGASAAATDTFPFTVQDSFPQYAPGDHYVTITVGP
ncbi:MAG TPA: Ig-like domain-containing protein [Verrucomicrobiae bacterium]|jgi:hypothetical protein|nr:Ig-like domain-containing protein [Verrucomicrobiae bacterium]